MLGLTLIKHILVLYFCLLNPVFGKQGFVTSFQPEIEGSFSAATDAWIMFPKPIPLVKEFTICHWINIKFFNTDIAACLWSYCTIEKIGDKMKCLQVCLYGISNTANRNLRIEGQIYLQGHSGLSFPSRSLNSYQHRTWTHLCWSFSAISGFSKFHHNGKLLGIDRYNVTDIDVAMKASNRVYESALIFGQEPDKMGGGFDKGQAYLGQLSEFNIWSYTINDLEISKMASCKKWPKGNIIDWKRSNLTVNNVRISDLQDLNEFCLSPLQYVIFPEKVRYPEAKETCEVHKGTLATPKSNEETSSILDIVLKHKEMCLETETSSLENAVWIGARKIDDLWYEVGDRDSFGGPLNYTNVVQSMSVSESKCAYLRHDGTWIEGQSACTLLSLCTVCEIKGNPVFTVKGICYMGDIDWNYYLSLDDKNQIKLYEGYKKTNIIYDQDRKKWNVSTKGEYPKNFEAQLATGGPAVISHGHVHDYRPIGRKKWFIIDPICEVSDSFYQLTVSVCNFTQFSCDSGHCVEIDKRCDEKRDCPDGTDEEFCDIIDIPPSYNRASVPKSVNEIDSLEIALETNIITIDSIDTVGMVITVTLEIRLQWYDQRLEFNNLKVNEDTLISNENAKQLWNPLRDLIHENAVIGEVTSDSDYDVKIHPLLPEDLDVSKSQENRVFNGSYNPLKQYQRFRIKYNCLFDVKNFPFDGQNCTFVMKMNHPQNKDKKIKFTNDGQDLYRGEPIVDQFLIGKMISIVNTTNESTKYVIVIPMTRLFTNQLLTTFVPTCILWLFGYSTLFIEPDEDGFSNRFMGAGTALLVIATLLNSINDDLPKTSYMKLIDLWFVWHILSVFAIIIYHIALDRLRTYFDNQVKDMVESFQATDIEKESQNLNGIMKINQINNIVVIAFPILNVLFYAVYFYFTLP